MSDAVAPPLNPRSERSENRLLKRFRRNRPAVVATFVLSAIILLAIFAPFVERHPFDQMQLRARSQPPSAEHWLGTDRVGRDVWSRTVHGARVSLIVGFAATAIAVSIGVVLGSLAGYHGGWVEALIMRATDVLMTFPPIIIMLTLAAFAPRGLWVIVFIIGGLSWPGVARLVRGQFLSLKEQEFVAAARALGNPGGRVMVVHILPNALPPLMAMVSFGIGNAILTEAGLSFLGLGVPPPAPSWGTMLEAARNLDILRNLPWTWMPPAIMIVITVLCVNFIGDGLRDATDARMVV
ncbi:MAG: ABC transporter permease [Trueperaceae bacterium]|nr:ABC transporter permease [Trueperaceae bacterium]